MVSLQGVGDGAGADTHIHYQTDELSE